MAYSPLKEIIVLSFLALSADAFSTFSPSPLSLLRTSSRCLFSPRRAVTSRSSSILRLRAQDGPPMDKEALDATEENVVLAIEEAKQTLGTIFGNSDENRKIGITGDCQMVDLDGPFVTVRLSGRFWHKRVDVLARVDNYLRMRIPELIEVNIEDPKQLNGADDSLIQFLRRRAP